MFGEGFEGWASLAVVAIGICVNLGKFCPKQYDLSGIVNPHDLLSNEQYGGPRPNLASKGKDGAVGF